MTADPTWKVLLIGGHSGTGKSLVARCLARRLGVGLVEVDDFRLVLERMTTPQQQPALHALLDIVSRPDASPEAVRDALIKAARTVSCALEIVVANHVATDAPTILEGDSIQPVFAAQRVFANLDVKDSVRAVFLVEGDEGQLCGNATQRQRGFGQLSAGHQCRTVRRSWLHGQWLRQEALRCGVPIVSPRPWETLEERILSAFQITTAR